MTPRPSPSALPCGPVTSVAAAVAQMSAIDAALPPTDGVSAFNRMYLAVTSSVGTAIKDGFFADSQFLDRLDIVFANHYFAALRRARDGGPVPRCWDVLWERRTTDGLAPIQFAFAGMNAHINHDLVLALVETLQEFDATPHDANMHGDFNRVNELLAKLDGTIRRSFETGLLLRVEQRWGAVEDQVDGWSIAAARAAAWRDAQLLWGIRDHRHIREQYERALDEAVALAGRCLLTPIGHHADHDCNTQGSVLAALADPVTTPRGAPADPVG